MCIWYIGVLLVGLKDQKKVNDTIDSIILLTFFNFLNVY